MRSSWLVAFALASVLAATATAMLRRLSLVVGFVDEPGPSKRHSRPIPYLGGVAIAGATLAGWLFEPQLSTRIAALALAGVAVALIGLLDDHRRIGPLARLTAEAAAAAGVVAAGVRAEPTNMAPVNIAITIVWIVGVTNALNLLDNMDGLAAGTAAAASAGVFALAAIEGQDMLATVAISLCGACVGFLVHNWRPASIFMGDAGALFIGFVLSVAVLELVPDVPSPVSLVVPALLLALPVLDTTVVSVARLRRGRSLVTGGQDHLSHRLEKLGLSPSVAVAILVVVEVLMATLAVLCGSAVLPVWVTVILAVTVLGALAMVATRAGVYPESPAVPTVRPWRRAVATPPRHARQYASAPHDAYDAAES
ncbi:MAG TPA: MraY family glycosyltransferase [Acidimicrobiia bacterium]|nr:MraY family glycosyltransferase [Acidimicrobiia bacterium]